jgi:uncharacterized protein YbjT (DUF2867 family)
MRVLATGATGLVGSAIVARLLAEGHAVVGLARHVERAARRLPQVGWVALDMGRAVSVRDWSPHLVCVDAVVNCAGILQDGPADKVSAVHDAGLAALVAACEAQGVQRFVQISALGIDKDAPTEFSQSKRRGDAALMASGLDWVVLRPAVITGRAAYGGSALFRGLAALPVLPVMPDTTPVQIVQLEDVAATVLFYLHPDAPVNLALDIAAPERLTVPEIVATYRRWLGWQPARLWHLPRWLGGVLYRLGDLAGALGWKPPLRSTARVEIALPRAADPAAWGERTGIVPRSLEAALAAEPASVQERWFAGLYFLKPGAIAAIALTCVVTGIMSIGPGYAEGVALLEAGGLGALAGPCVIAGGLADIAIGFAIAWRPTARLGLYAALAITLFYLAAGTILLPGLWLDPLGRYLKAVPFMVLNLVAIATLEDR